MEDSCIDQARLNKWDTVDNSSQLVVEALLVSNPAVKATDYDLKLTYIAKLLNLVALFILLM